MSEQSSTFDITQMTSGSQQNDLLAELVGEGKKFKDTQALARGKLESDDFIQKLQVENKALREAMDSETPDAVLTKINELLNTKGGSGNVGTTASNQSQAANPLSEEKVLELLNQREQLQRKTSNVNEFNSTVTKHLGEKTAEVVGKRLGELGLDGDVFQTMVERNPQAALKLLGIKEAGPSGGGMDSSVNTEAFFGPAGNNGEKQNFAYFQKLRHELKERYYEPQVQKQVFEARKKLGEDFWKA